MSKANFMPVRFEGAFEMWSPDRLVIETVTKRSGSDSWMQVRSSRDDRYEEVSGLVEDTQERVIEASRAGELTAYVHVVETGLFYVIPAPVWDGNDAIGYLAGRLYKGVMDDDYHRSMPDNFMNTPIMFLGAEAKTWLKGATVGLMPAKLPTAVPSGDLVAWYNGLTKDERASKRTVLLQMARDRFPQYHVARDRVADIRMKDIGHLPSGRPKTNGDVIGD